MGEGFLRVIAMAVLLCLGCSKAYIESYNRGVDYLGRGAQESAIREFRDCLRENPKYSEAHYGLGKCYNALGERDKAENEFRQALRLNPGNSRAHWALALILYDRGEKVQALSRLQKSYRLKRDPDCAYNLGVVARELKRYQTSLSCLKVALREYPSSPDVLENLALTCEALGRRGEAIGYWREGLKFEKDQEEAEKIGAHLARLGGRAEVGGGYDPVVEIISPREGIRISTQTVNVVGTIFDDDRVERIYVNGRMIAGERKEKLISRKGLPFTPKDRFYFELEVPLETGTNEIVVEAYDSSGRRGKESVVVTRE